MDLQARIERRVSLDIVRHADYHRRSHLHEHAPSRPGTPSPRLHRARTSIICSLLLYITEGEVISMYWPATETPAPYSPGTRKGSGPNLQRAESHQYGHGHRHNRKWPRKRFSPVRSARHEPRTRSETADHVSRRVALPTSELRNVVEVAPVHGDCGAALEGGAGQAHRPYRDPG